MSEISIALSKGRIFDETAPLLARVGLTPKGNGESSRKLILETNRADVRLIEVRGHTAILAARGYNTEREKAKPAFREEEE